MSDNRILVEECDTDFRKYHTNWELTRIPKMELERGGVVICTPKGKRAEEKIDQLEESRLAHSIVSIEGVSKVIVSPYCLSVYIGKAFGWEPIQEQVVNSLKENLIKKHASEIKEEFRCNDANLAAFLDRASGRVQDPIGKTLDDFLSSIGLEITISELPMPPHSNP